MFFIQLAIVAVVSGSVGTFIGALVIRVHQNNLHNEQLKSFASMINNVIAASHKSTNAFATAISMQSKAYQSLKKEKKLIMEQLDNATEHITEIEGMLEDEDDDDSSDSEDKPAVSKSLANDKLITVRKILEDASKKNEQVDPQSLLGIVNHKGD